MPTICIVETCSKRCSYNFPDEKAIYCGSHKEDGMVNVNKPKCPHGKRKSYCTQCGGSEVCEHGKRKSRCILCGGTEICQHGKRKEICKLCDGSSLCIHGRQKIKCRDCNGSQICIHGKRKERCSLCGGKGLCIHNKQKEYCKLCKGSQICEHNKVRSRCHKCDGSEICSHKILKQNCKLCDGSSFCKHNKYKILCKQCGGSQLCKSSWCETHKRKGANGYCTRCFVYNNPDAKLAKNYKTKEIAVRDYVKNTFPDVDWSCDKIISNGCSRRRPDLLCDMGSHVIIVEIDENQHNSYEEICENKRVMELSQDVGHRPVVFIRFNPDSYKKGDVRVPSCFNIKHGILCLSAKQNMQWCKRIDKLRETIEYWFSNVPNKTIQTEHLFFDE